MCFCDAAGLHKPQGPEHLPGHLSGQTLKDLAVGFGTVKCRIVWFLQNLHRSIRPHASWKNCKKPKTLKNPQDPGIVRSFTVLVSDSSSSSNTSVKAWPSQVLSWRFRPVAPVGLQIKSLGAATDDHRKEAQCAKLWPLEMEKKQCNNYPKANGMQVCVGFNNFLKSIQIHNTWH